MQLKDNANKKFCLITAMLLLASVILGRLTSYFNTISATDIAIADWVTTLLTYLGEVFVACRTVISFSAIAAAFYLLDRRSVKISVILTAGFALLDYAARFLIDFATGAVTGAETLALIWLLLQFVYEAIFIALSVLIIYMVKKKFESAETPRTAAKYSCIRSVRYALILILLSNIASEAVYLVDFLLSYTNITNTEIASMIGSFLKIIVIWGGISLILAEGMQSLYAKVLLELEDKQ